MTSSMRAARVARRDALDLGAEREEAADGKVRIEHDVLGQVADPFADGERVLLDVEAVDRHAAFARRKEPGEDPHDRRLAGAVGSEESHDLPARTEKLTPSTAAWSPEILDETLNLDHRRCASCAIS